VAANFLWRGRISEAAAVLTDGLQALSHAADRERASLHAYLSLCDWSLSDLDGALQRVDQAVNTAQQLADMSVLSRALWSKSYLHRMSDEPIAAVEAGRRALGLLGPGAVWDRAELFGAIAIALFDGGRFSEIDALLPELEATANRAGHHGVLWLHERIVHSREAMNTGDLRTLLAQSEQALRGSAQWTLPNRNYTAVLRLYLGQVDEALDEFRAVVSEQPDNFWFKGMPEANLFCGSALAGRVDQARTLLPAMAQWLPTIERRHHLGAWFALQASVTGLALLGDRERCGALYPVTLAKVATGTVVSGNPVGPANPQLVAAIAADAAGLTEKARGHFEAAACQARDLPNRILQPAVQYWYGRTLSAHVDPVEQARGRAMIESAAADFHTLGMVLHSRLANDFLARRAHN
jgi:tetratricopeptide (TPR) repeat protein